MILKHILQEKELIREKKIAFATSKSVDKKKETLQIQQDVLRKKRIFENIEDGKPLKRTKGSFDSDKSNAKDSNFWLAEATPDAGIKAEKPLQLTPLCPRSRKPLKFKKLKHVNFLFNDLVQFGEKGYILCAATRKPITFEKCILIKSTGDIVMKSYFESVSTSTKPFIWNGKRIALKDIIYLK